MPIEKLIKSASIIQSSDLIGFHFLWINFLVCFHVFDCRSSSLPQKQGKMGGTQLKCYEKNKTIMMKKLVQKRLHPMIKSPTLIKLRQEFSDFTFIFTKI